MKNKEIKDLAFKIVKMEQELSKGKNVQENMKEIQEISKTLSLEDMFMIDDYITKNKLLTN
jgi:hypothetical protein|nr:MAG TPA: hypothetical protein [Caudoviricetes sp.]